MLPLERSSIQNARTRSMQEKRSAQWGGGVKQDLVSHMLEVTILGCTLLYKAFSAPIPISTLPSSSSFGSRAGWSVYNWGMVHVRISGKGAMGGWGTLTVTSTATLSVEHYHPVDPESKMAPSG